jgi:purine catabolism regulator
MAKSVESVCTVETLIERGIFRPDAVLAGRAGLGRPVTMASIVEVPDIVDWIHPGELLITTAYAFKDNVELLGELVPAFADRGLAGLAIKPRRYLTELPRYVLDLADHLGFPIIEPDPEVTFGELLRRIYRLIQTDHEHGEGVLRAKRDQLTKTITQGGGLEQLAAELGQAVARPVLIEHGKHHRPVFSGAALGSLQFGDLLNNVQWHRSRKVAEAITEYAMNRQSVPFRRVLESRMSDGQRTFGFIYVFDDARELEPELTELLAHANSLALMEIRRLETAREVERRYRDIFLGEWLNGTLTERQDIVERGRHFGWDLEKRYVLVVARERGRRAARTGWSERLNIILQTRGDHVILLIPGPPYDLEDAGMSPDALAGLMTRLGWDQGESLYTVSPEALACESVPKVYRELLEVLEVAELLNHRGLVTRDDLGIYGLWPLIPDKARLKLFLERLLKPLLDYDAAHHAELLATLETLLDCQGNITTTAKRLYVHYNTVLYRVRKIEELLSKPLDASDSRVLLHVAVKLWRAFEG